MMIRTVVGNLVRRARNVATHEKCLVHGHGYASTNTLALIFSPATHMSLRSFTYASMPSVRMARTTTLAVAVRSNVVRGTWIE